MVKVEIKEDDGSKVFFCDGVQFKNHTETVGRIVFTQSFVTIINNNAKVKSCQMMLSPGDLVFIEECDL